MKTQRRGHTLSQTPPPLRLLSSPPQEAIERFLACKDSGPLCIFLFLFAITFVPPPPPPKPPGTYLLLHSRSPRRRSVYNWYCSGVEFYPSLTAPFTTRHLGFSFGAGPRMPLLFLCNPRKNPLPPPLPQYPGPAVLSFNHISSKSPSSHVSYSRRRFAVSLVSRMH